MKKLSIAIILSVVLGGGVFGSENSRSGGAVDDQWLSKAKNSLVTFQNYIGSDEYKASQARAMSKIKDCEKGTVQMPVLNMTAVRLASDRPANFIRDGAAWSSFTALIAGGLFLDLLIGLPATYILKTGRVLGSRWTVSSMDSLKLNYTPNFWEDSKKMTGCHEYIRSYHPEFWQNLNDARFALMTFFDKVTLNEKLNDIHRKQTWREKRDLITQAISDLESIKGNGFRLPAGNLNSFMTQVSNVLNSSDPIYIYYGKEELINRMIDLFKLSLVSEQKKIITTYPEVVTLLSNFENMKTQTQAQIVKNPKKFGLIKMSMKEKLDSYLREAKSFLKKLTDNWVIIHNGHPESKERYLASFSGNSDESLRVKKHALANFISISGKTDKRNTDHILFKWLADVYKSINVKVIENVNATGSEALTSSQLTILRSHEAEAQDPIVKSDLNRTIEKASTTSGMSEIYKEFGTRGALLILISILEERVKKIKKEIDGIGAPEGSSEGVIELDLNR